MKTITVSVDEETHRLARIRASELDTSVSVLVQQYLRSLGSSAEADADSDKADAEIENEAALVRRRRRLREVLSDFDARGVGVSGWLTRDELYNEAINGSNALR